MKTKSLLMILGAILLSICLFSSCSSDDDGEGNNVNGWYRLDGGYIIFKALHFNGTKMTEYFRVEADYEPDWQEWDDAAKLPGHSDYYYGTRSAGSHNFTIKNNKIVLDNGREYTIKGGKIYCGSDVYRRW